LLQLCYSPAFCDRKKEKKKNKNKKKKKKKNKKKKKKKRESVKWIEINTEALTPAAPY
jgi:hypothetical protein